MLENTILMPSLHPSTKKEINQVQTHSRNKTLNLIQWKKAWINCVSDLLAPK